MPRQAQDQTPTRFKHQRGTSNRRGFLCELDRFGRPAVMGFAVSCIYFMVLCLRFFPPSSSVGIYGLGMVIGVGLAALRTPVRKRSFGPLLIRIHVDREYMLKSTIDREYMLRRKISLPRQARDRHRETSNRARCLTALQLSAQLSANYRDDTEAAFAVWKRVFLRHFIP